MTGLYGLSLASGYYGLEFKFRVYDGDIVIADSNQYI
jgi:hypothetical protein